MAKGIIGLLLAAAAFGQTPTQLVGEWSLSDGTNPSLAYTITPDGRFLYSSQSISASPGCDTRVSALSQGRLEVEGSLIHLDPASSSFRSVNTCRPKWDYEKPGQLGRNTYRWRVERQGSGSVLVLRQRSGMEQRFLKR